MTRSRRIDAAPAELWTIVSDPHHLPRWWPRVTRVQSVTHSAFTEVLRSDRGNLVRADFTLLESDERALRIRWAQQVLGTPFARVLSGAETEVRLQPVSGEGGGAATEVTIALKLSLRGVFANLGAVIVRRAAATTVKEALDGLQRIAG